MTIAGILDIVLGGLGLAVACVATLVIGIMLFGIALKRASSPPAELHHEAVASLSMAQLLIVPALEIVVSALADAWLIATGLQLLGRSRIARRSAITFACLMVPLGVLDIGAASRYGDLSWILLVLVLPLPIYAVAQVAAFFLLPSWKALNGSPPRSTPDAAIGT